MTIAESEQGRKRERKSIGLDSFIRPVGLFPYLLAEPTFLTGPHGRDAGTHVGVADRARRPTCQERRHHRVYSSND